MSFFQKLLSFPKLFLTYVLTFGFSKPTVSAITADFTKKVKQLRELAVAKERESGLINEQIVDLKEAARNALDERAKAMAVADKISYLIVD